MLISLLLARSHPGLHRLLHLTRPLTLLLHHTALHSLTRALLHPSRSRLLPARRSRSLLSRPPSPHQYLLSAPHRPPERCLLTVEQIVLTQRTDPLVLLLVQRRQRHSRRSRRLLASPRRDLRRQEPHGWWADEVLSIRSRRYMSRWRLPRMRNS